MPIIFRPRPHKNSLFPAIGTSPSPVAREGLWAVTSKHQSQLRVRQRQKRKTELSNVELDRHDPESQSLHGYRESPITQINHL